jgi:hypothetical protein
LNAVEIEEAISNLAEQAFDAASFPYAFLEAFGNKVTTIKRLQSGSSNKSDIGGVLQTNNIHIAVCAEGASGEKTVTATLNTLKASPATAKAKAKFTLATDGITLEAEDLNTNETVACDYKDFPNHFGFFLPLAGITTVKQIRDNTFDIRATSRLNRLYVELLKNNADWGNKQGVQQYQVWYFTPARMASPVLILEWMDKRFGLASWKSLSFFKPPNKTCRCTPKTFWTTAS